MTQDHHHVVTVDELLDAILGDEDSVSVVTLVDRNAAVAEVSYVTTAGRYFCETGSAKREPGDPRSDVGEQLAIARALKHLADAMYRDAQARVSHAIPVIPGEPAYPGRRSHHRAG